MASFSQWLALNEDVTGQKTSFIQLFKSIFPDAQIDQEAGALKAVAPVAGRNVVVSWHPGTDYRNKSGATEETASDSYVKIDFFNLTPDENDDYVGAISKTGIRPESVSFAKVLLQLVKGLKNLGIHIMFDAVGMGRADSYANLLKKVGYTLGVYKNQIQMWLAKPVEGMTASQNPYDTDVNMKRTRQTAPSPVSAPGIRISM